jgi:hypothetical protein
VRAARVRRTRRKPCGSTQQRTHHATPGGSPTTTFDRVVDARERQAEESKNTEQEFQKKFCSTNKKRDSKKRNRRSFR